MPLVTSHSLSDVLAALREVQFAPVTCPWPSDDAMAHLPLTQLIAKDGRIELRLTIETAG